MAAADASALKAAVASGDVPKASALLAKLKVTLAACTSLPPLCEQTPNAAAELALAREVYEQAVCLSVLQKDDATFERHFSQLKPLYTDVRHLLPPSQGEHHLTGLNLLRLLVQNRTAEFHTELEVLTPDALGSAPVKYAVTLEQSLMEGAYNKVLASAAAPPDASSGWLTQRLATTVRDEVAACAAAAYDTLPLATAQNLLRLDSAAATTAFCAQRGWTLRGDVIDFAGAAAKAESSVPAAQLISSTLAYARELERII